MSTEERADRPDDDHLSDGRPLVTEAEARRRHSQKEDPKPGGQAPPSKGRPQQTAEPPSEETEHEVGVTLRDLEALYLLESVKGFGPAKFKEIFDAGLTFQQVVHDPDRLPATGKRGDELRREVRRLASKGDPTWRDRAMRQIAAAHRHGARIVTYWTSSYPKRVLDSNHPVPAIYVIGSPEVLSHPRAVACVGSRGIRAPYADKHRSFAEAAIAAGFTIVSGFALGADTIGHRAAYEAKGRTVCVMPCGLDRPFPPENKPFWQQLLTYPDAALVSEFTFGTSASTLTLRKRNKLIVAFAAGVLMSQSSDKGGAMNAYRFALEQHKPIATFGSDGSSDTSGNRLAVTEAKGDVTELACDTSTSGYEEWLRRLSPST